MCGLSPPLLVLISVEEEDGRRNFINVALISLWLSVESAAIASSVSVGIVSEIIVVAVDGFVAWDNWVIRGFDIWVRWDGDCQNSIEVFALLLVLFFFFFFFAGWYMVYNYILTILVMLKFISEHTHGSQPKRCGTLIGWTGFVQDFNYVIQNITRVASYNGLDFCSN